MKRKIKCCTIKEYIAKLSPERKAHLAEVKERRKLYLESKEQRGDKVGSLKSGLSPS